MPAIASNSLLSGLEGLLAELDAEKSAAARMQKKASTEAGGYDGSSSHPSAKVDDNTQAGGTGARAAENATDVKETVPGLAVDKEPEASPNQDEQDKVQLNIGTVQSATGEDPATEDAYKGTKEDPGTTHPAVTDDGKKYGSAFLKKAKALSQEANLILADLITSNVSQNGKAAQAPAPQAQTASDAEIKTAVERGYQLAAALGVPSDPTQRADYTIELTCKNGAFDATLVGDYLTRLHKLAMEETAGEDHDQPGDETSGRGEGGEEAAEGEGGGAPVDSGAGMGSGGADPAALLAALGGGGGGGGGGGDLGMGGGMGGGDMGGGAGGPMGGGALDAMAGGGGEPSEQEVLQELAAALAELGISPQDLVGKAAADFSRHNKQQLEKIASTVHGFMLSGNFQVKEARTKRARKIRDDMKDYVREVIGTK